MIHQPIECLGVVLAGGLSSRMGQDKSQLARTNAVSMLDYSKQLLSDAGIKDIVISGDNYQVPDLISQAGPVGGIYSVLAHFADKTQPKALLILPVDLPLMTATELSSLRIKGELANKATFFKDDDNRAHHIPLYIPNNAYLELFIKKAFQATTLLAPQDKANKKNAPSVRAMLEQLPHQAIKSGNNRTLFNTNTPQQWQQAKSNF